MWMSCCRRCLQFSEFLTKRLRRVEDVGAYYPHRVTYHASCRLGCGTLGVTGLVMGRCGC